MIRIFNQVAGFIFMNVAKLIFRRSLTKKIFLREIKAVVDSTILQPLTLNDNLPKVLMLVEDKRFLFHKGVDFYAIGRAAVSNIFKDRLEGASTITQQLVRSITNDRVISFRRKFDEMLYAVMIDSEYEKDQILLVYLQRGLDRLSQFSSGPIEGIDIAVIVLRFKYVNLCAENYIRYLKRVRKVEKIMVGNNLFYKIRNHDRFVENSVNKNDIKTLSLDKKEFEYAS